MWRLVAAGEANDTIFRFSTYGIEAWRISISGDAITSTSVSYLPRLYVTTLTLLVNRRRGVGVKQIGLRGNAANKPPTRALLAATLYVSTRIPSYSK